MEDKNITKERQDYLKVIYLLQQDESPVRTTSIAKKLNIEPASVTGIIKKLAELDFVAHTPYRGVTLTPQGEKAALQVIRNHRLIELYLIEALNYSWDEVHDEAERLEHAVSPLFVERIDEALGYPEIDPHGAPIPNEQGEIAARSTLRLSDLNVGQTGLVMEVDDDNPHLLRHLDSMTLRPGEKVYIQDIDQTGNLLQIEVNTEKHVLGREVAEHVFVEISPSTP